MTTALVTRNELEEAIGQFDWGRSVVAPSKDVQFVVEDDKLRARIGDEDLGVTPQGLEQALVKVPGLAKAAVTQWPIDLFVDTVNWFYEHADGDSRALVKEDKVVGFTRDAQTPTYAVGQVLETMETSLSEAGADLDDLRFNNVRVDMDRVAMGLVVPSRTSEPKVNDIVQAGIWFQHSPTAKKGGEISPYVNRLVCTNGMISARSLQKWTWRGGDQFMDWVSMATTASWNSIDLEFDGLKELTDQPLNGHATTVLEDLFERHHVPANLRSRVLEAVVDEADGTMYGIAQAFNRAANGLEDIGQMRGLLMVTGNVVAQEERCASCFRSL